MRTFLFCLFCTILVQFTAAQEGIQFFSGSWEEALAEAKKQDKPIFVDAYATWCGPCKIMSARVFTNPKVGTLFNTYFINVKLDMEKEESLSFREHHSVSAYPTLFFFRADGDLERRVKGAQQIESLLQLGQSVLRSLEPLEAYAKRYEGGDREPEFVYRYLQALIRVEEPYGRIANAYFRDQKEQLTTEENLRLIFKVTEDADSKAFGLLCTHQEDIRALVGEELFSQKVEDALIVCLEKAKEYRSPFLFEQAIEQAEGTIAADRLRRLDLEGQLYLFDGTGSLAAFLSLCDQYAQKIADDRDSNAFYQLASKLYKFYPSESAALDRILKYSKIAYEGSLDPSHGLLHAKALAILGKERSARRFAREILDRTPNNNKRARQEVIRFLDQL